MSIWELVLEESIKTIVVITTTAILGGFIWLLTLRKKSSDIKLLLKRKRKFVLYYRGESELEKNKEISFNDDGTIGEGNNFNESFWQVRFGRLEIYTNGKYLFSRFIWDKKFGKLTHTNEPRLPSVMGQFIIPSYVPASDNKSLYSHLPHDKINRNKI